MIAFKSPSTFPPPSSPSPPPFLIWAGKKSERLTEVQSTILDQIPKVGTRKAGWLWPLLRLQNSSLVEVLHQRDFFRTYVIILDALAIMIMQLCYQNYSLNTDGKFNFTCRVRCKYSPSITSHVAPKGWKNRYDFSHL